MLIQMLELSKIIEDTVTQGETKHSQNECNRSSRKEMKVITNINRWTFQK
jgi:hypothetical protein